MTASSFAEIAASYADAVADNFRQPVAAQPEDQLKAPVGDLLRAAGSMTGLDVRWRTEVRADDVHGRPDLGVTVNGLLTGHVELKRPGLGARPERFTGANRAQWLRFKALPNLIYTDGSEWSLYRTGKLVARIRIADDVSEGGARALDRESLADLARLFRAFLYWEPVVPGTAQGLAEFLAALARILRDEVQWALARSDSPLRTLADEWGRLLFPETDDAQFADAYAQTLTYALLLARFEGAESLSPAFASETLQSEHALLAEALRLLEVSSVREELRMPIELLERAIGAVDAVEIQHEGDPWLYFYEDFLGAYDPKLRKDRGVYYTPVEVVRLQVRLAAELLRTRFNKRLAFADDDVVVLDPAVGTGTYPLAVLDHAADAVRQRLGPGAVPQKLRDLAGHLNGFELLVGPYSVAHLRVSQRLRDAGVNDRPARIYLTDTLESPNQLSKFRASLLQQRLTEERERAQKIKKEVRVFVCLGNPPYNRDLRDPGEADSGRRKGGWVRHGDKGADQPPILEDFLKPVRDAGGGFHLKPLYNDYVYFWRWALWKVFDSSEDAGIVTFITASSYLRGPGFAGMRRKMREVFDELWIIDLEGDSIGARKTENVFAIQISVAIAIGVRNGSPKPGIPAEIWKAKLTGTEDAKLNVLGAAEGFSDFEWRKCSDDWLAPFYPSGSGTYSSWPQVIDLFPWQHSGTAMYRTWPIGETPDVLAERWRNLLGRSTEGRRVAFRETRDRKINGRYPPLMGEDMRDPSIMTLNPVTQVPLVARYSYRAFDRQWIIADSRVGDYLRPDLWRMHGSRQVYITVLLAEVPSHGPGAVATPAIPDLHYFCGRGTKDVIPLWRNAAATQPNVTAGLLSQIADVHGAPVSPERLFAYAYSVLAQPAYVERFWDELELPPPRLPITKDAGLFGRVADHGARLLYLHTYGERYGGPHDDGSVPQGVALCTKAVSLEQYPADFSYDEAAQVLRVGDGEFAPVTPEVWAYSVSGLQVVKSWLDYRKLKRAGRRSSPLDDIRPARWDFTEELLELLWVLEETIHRQPEGTALLQEVCASALFAARELPAPTETERQPPLRARQAAGQLALGSGSTG